MQNKKSFVLCLIAGILLLIAGAVGSIGALEFLSVIGTIPELELLVPIVDILLKVLVFIAGLGGIGVIAGGFLITTPRVGTGKFIIGIAAGMGLIGLIIQLVKVIYFAGVEGLVNLLEISNPEYMASMTDETAGKFVVGFAVMLLVVGGAWLKKLVNVEF